MKNHYILTLLIFVSCSLEKQPDLPSQPETPIKVSTIEYWGYEITDSYQYLEDDKDSAVIKWLRDQNEYTTAVLSKIPGIQKLKERIKELNESSNIRTGVPVSMNGKAFYVRNFLDQELEVLYYQDGLGGDPIELFNTLSMGKDGYYTISYFEPSFDAHHVILGVSKDGSEDATLMVIDVNAQELLPDKIERAPFPATSWTPDGTGFFYNQMKELQEDDPDSEKYLDSEVKYHRLGKPVQEDQTILSARNNPGLSIESLDFPLVTTLPGDEQLYGFIVKGVENEYRMLTTNIKDLANEKMTWEEVFSFEDMYSDAGFFGDEIFVRSAKDAPRYRIEVINQSLSNPPEIVIENSERVIQDIYQTLDGLYIHFVKDGISELELLDPKTRETQSIPLPFKGSLTLDQSPWSNSTGLYFGMSAWNRGWSIYYYDPEKAEVIKTDIRPSGPYDFPGDIVVEEVLVTSHDGVQVPLSIIYHEKIAKNGANPALLAAYGSYGYSYSSGLNLTMTAWLEKGGIFSVAHVRGGGEYGKEWHDAGKKATKENTWLDFIACAEYLIQNGYTSEENLAGSGTSAGGITVGMAANIKPSLFKAIVPRVGSLNPISETLGITGPANVPEFGSLDDSLEFLGLLKMDAYLNIKDEVAYPAQLITAGMNDPRVPAWGPGKYAARMQAAQSDKSAPVLLRVEFAGGHGIGSSAEQRANEWGDIFGFLFWQLGHPDFQIE